MFTSYKLKRPNLLDWDPYVKYNNLLRKRPSRTWIFIIVRGQGAKVLVGDFGLARVSDSDPFFRNWRQLDNTTLYALPLN